MLVLKIVAALLGLAFTLFGYFIYFKGKYSLINGFDEDLKAGIKSEAYARRVGLAELIVGIVLLITAVLLLLLG